MEELTAGVNWLAVIVGFVAAFMLGWLWYSPKLFGKRWAEGLGIDLGSSSEMPAAAMITQALGTFLLSWVVGVTAASNALLLVLLIILTIMVLQASAGFFTKKSGGVVMIEVGFTLAMAVVMIAFQGLL